MRDMGRFWLFYYLLFGPRYTRWALLLFVLAMGFFFFCFVHEAFDSPRTINSAVALIIPKRWGSRYKRCGPQAIERQKSHRR